MENPFTIEKGKKTGYYQDTWENRKKGVVGQKYTVEVTDITKKTRIQSQLDVARRKREMFGSSESTIKNKIQAYDEQYERQAQADKEWSEEHGDYHGPDWRISDTRVRNNFLLEEAEASIVLNLDTDETKMAFVNAFEDDRVNRISHMKALVDALFLNPGNERIEEELIWVKTKDLELVMEFNSIARKNGITQMIPKELLDLSPKPSLRMSSWEKLYVIDDHKGADVANDRVPVFKDHIESEAIWSPNPNDFDYGKSIGRGFYKNGLDELEEIDIFKSDSRKDYLSRLPVLDLSPLQVGEFMTRPFKYLNERNLIKGILGKDKRYGSVIVSFEGNDYLFMLKKVSFSVTSPKSKKKARIVSDLSFKSFTLKDQVSNLNYKLPTSTIEPIRIEKINRTLLDDKRDLERDRGKINAERVQNDIDEMEKLTPYERDEDELDALYFQINKYHELGVFIENIQKQILEETK